VNNLNFELSKSRMKCRCHWFGALPYSIAFWASLAVEACGSAVKPLPHHAPGVAANAAAKPTPLPSLDEFVARLQKACPGYDTTSTEEAPTVVEAFPDELRWGYPQVSLKPWTTAKGRSDLALLIPGEGCQHVDNLHWVDQDLQGGLITPVETDPNARSVTYLEVQPLLRRVRELTHREKLEGGKWVLVGGAGTTCPEGEVLGLLTEVRADRALFAGQPAAVSATCDTNGAHCHCPRVVLKAELDFGGCLRQSPGSCASSASVAAALERLPAQPWLSRSAEDSPILFRSWQACEDAYARLMR
jgi:hypothetical protein